MELKRLDYDYGFYTGRRFKRLFNIFARICELEGKEVLSQSQRHILTLKKYYPQRLERIRGLGFSLGINPDRLLALPTYLSKFIKVGCTNTVCAPPATKDGQIYLSWNMDIFSATRVMRYLPLLHISDLPNSHKYFCLGLPCLGGLGLLNDQGLSYAPTAVGMKDGGGEGLLDFELNNLAMESCENVEEVVSLYKDKPKYSFPGWSAGIFLNLNCIWGDSLGGGVAIEHSSHHLAFEYLKEGIMAIANHHQFLNRDLTGSVNPDQMPAISGSYCRLGRMWNLLKSYQGEIDLKVMKKITADHKLEIEHLKGYSYQEPVDDATICGHYWNLLDHLKRGRIKRAVEAYLMGRTILSWIIEPKKLTIWLCRGNPCRSPFIPIYCAEMLGAPPPSFDSHKEKESRIINSALKINTKIDRSFWRIPGTKKALDALFQYFLKKLLLLSFFLLEKIIPISHQEGRRVKPQQ